MSEENIDETTARDWSDVTERLATWLEEGPEETTLILEIPQFYDVLQGAMPYTRIVVDDYYLVRAEAASNHVLDTRLTLDLARISELEAMGWSPPTCGLYEDPGEGSNNFYIDLELPEDADQLADLLVATMRDIYGAPHPSFLAVEGFRPSGRLDAPGLPFGPPLTPPDAPDDEIRFAMPESADDLRDLVEATLATVVGHALTYDSDGDIPLFMGGALIFVRVEKDAPSVRVFAPLLSDVRWTPRVGSTIADLNLRARYGKVIFHDGVISATQQLYGLPFIPAHLCHAIEGIRVVLNDVVDDLHATLGGEAFIRGAANDSAGEDTA
jgi:hypothetical protein